MIRYRENDALGMAGDRSRNPKGPLREKRGDTSVGNVEKQYGVNFGVRSDMHLNTLLNKKGFKSLNDLIHNEK